MSIINERQQITFNELSDISFCRGIEKDRLKAGLLASWSDERHSLQERAAAC